MIVIKDMVFIIYFAFVEYVSKTSGCTSIGYGRRVGDG